MIAEVRSYRRDFPKPSHRATPRCQGAVPYCFIVRTTLICIAALICTASLVPVRADEAEYVKIREAMTKLAPLADKWNAAVTFHDQDGVTEEVGTWSVSFVLDDTYLEFQTERHIRDHPERNNKIIFYVTFNPGSNRYETTYFYNRWALRVTETGEYDDRTRERTMSTTKPYERSLA